jgi:hypothetical protein
MGGSTMNLKQIINPFRIDIDPMERLLLVNFERDPDTTYVGFEPQVFDDPVNGRGHLVIGWRRDGRVDVYHQTCLRLNAAKYDIAGKGLAHMVEREMAGATYEVDDFGVQAHYEFQDIHNRTVVLDIHEQNPRVRQPFGLLAPMGAARQKPLRRCRWCCCTTSTSSGCGTRHSRSALTADGIGPTCSPSPWTSRGCSSPDTAPGR